MRPKWASRVRGQKLKQRQVQPHPALPYLSLPFRQRDAAPQLVDVHGPRSSALIRSYGQRLEGKLSQLRVLRLRLLEDGNVRIGVFPEREEVCVCSFRFCNVALHGVSAAELKMGKSTDR